MTLCGSGPIAFQLAETVDGALDASYVVLQKLSSPDSGSLCFCVGQLRGHTAKKFYPHRPRPASQHRLGLDGRWHFMITVLLVCVELTDRFGRMIKSYSQNLRIYAISTHQSTPTTRSWNFNTINGIAWKRIPTIKLF